VGSRVAQWTTFKQANLPDLNRQLRQADLPPINVTEIEESEFLLSQ